MRRAVLVLSGAAAVATLLVGCSSDGSQAPDYQPSPGRSAIEHSPGVQIKPILPVPSLSDPNGGGSGPGGGGNPGGGGSSSGKKIDPLVVATKLKFPVGLTMMPDGTALVGERTTGRIVRVQPEAGRPVPTVRTIGGLDSSGDGGLLDLALSPSYSEDSLIYAYVTTPKDNRVVTFTLDGPVTPVITGIPKGATGNTGRLQFSSSGTLSVGTGDTGKPSLATRSSSLAGKILRITDIGKPASGNPKATSPVFTSGHREVDGLCAIPRTKSVFEVEAGAGGAAEVNVVTKGANYASTPPTASVPTKYGAPGDCAVLNNQLWVTSLDGKALLSAPLKTSRSTLTIGKFTPTLVNKYGRLKTVVTAPDGALWLTTSNRDGKGKPVAADERVIRYVPDGKGGGGGSPV